KVDTCEHNTNPKKQTNKKRQRNRIVALREQKQTRVCYVTSDLRCAIFKGTLFISLRRQLMELYNESFACCRCFEGRIPRRDRTTFVPNSISNSIDCAPQQIANWGCFRSVLRQELIEQNDIGSQLLNLGNLCIKRGLRRSNQEPKHECGYCSDKTRAEPHHVLCIGAQVVVAQLITQQHTDHCAG